MSELVTIRNKRHGSLHTVTSEEWEAMQAKGHGLKIFSVQSVTEINPQPSPRKLNLIVPPEVQEIQAKKEKVEEVAPVSAPETKPGKAAATKSAKKDA